MACGFWFLGWELVSVKIKEGRKSFFCGEAFDKGPRARTTEYSKSFSFAAGGIAPRRDTTGVNVSPFSNMTFPKQDAKYNTQKAKT